MGTQGSGRATKLKFCVQSPAKEVWNLNRLATHSKVIVVTFLLMTWMFGRAVLCKMNIRLIKMPTMMPNSSESVKQANRVAIIGITSIRLQHQISAISCVSTMAIMAHMMTAASVVFGMYWNDEVRKPRASNTMIPVKMPPIGVRTPLALFTAVRVNEPVDGMDWTNEPNILHRPSANISCVASTVFPLAEKTFFVKNWKWWKMCRYLHNAFVTATHSNIAIKGIAMIDEPRWLTISKTLSVWLPIVVSNGGKPMAGNPDATLPEKKMEVVITICH